MKTIKRMLLVAGVLTLPVTVIQGKDTPQAGIEGLSLGYTSDWIIKLSETTEKVDLLEIDFSSLKETVTNKGLFFPDTSGLKMHKVTPPKVDENMEKRPNG